MHMQTVLFLQEYKDGSTSMCRMLVQYNIKVEQSKTIIEVKEKIIGELRKSLFQ